MWASWVLLPGLAAGCSFSSDHPAWAPPCLTSLATALLRANPTGPTPTPPVTAPDSLPLLTSQRRARAARPTPATKPPASALSKGSPGTPGWHIHVTHSPSQTSHTCAHTRASLSHTHSRTRFQMRPQLCISVHFHKCSRVQIQTGRMLGRCRKLPNTAKPPQGWPFTGGGIINDLFVFLFLYICYSMVNMHMPHVNPEKHNFKKPPRTTSSTAGRHPHGSPFDPCTCSLAPWLRLQMDKPRTKSLQALPEVTQLARGKK